MPPVKEKAPAAGIAAVKEKSAKKLAAEAKRVVVYPEIDIKLYSGDEPLTAEMAKELLGWQEETDEIKFGSDFTLTLHDGRKVRCLNNSKNRPFDESHSKALCQDILNGHWKLNLETIIIGVFGSIISGQHRLIALVLAEMARTSSRMMDDGTKESDHWKAKWKSPVTIDVLVAVGADESPETLRTLDNVRPRTLADVLYTQDEFAKFKSKDRVALCRIMDYAIRLLWRRAGADKDAYNPKRTHSEALDFISRHGRLKDAVKHVYEENLKGNAIAKVVPCGTAAGLLYLMATCESDPEAYANAAVQNEKTLSFKQWDRAQEFWVELASGNQLKAVVDAFHRVAEPVGEGDDAVVTLPIGASNSEKIAIITKAWQMFLAGKPVELDAITPRINVDDEQVRHLADSFELGGIDCGDGTEVWVAGAHDVDPDEEEEEEEEEVEVVAKPAAKKKKPALEVSDMKPPKKGADNNKPAASPVVDELKALKEVHGEALILFRDESTVYIYNEDAAKVAKQLRTPTRKTPEGVVSTFFFRKDWEANVEKLNGAGLETVTVERRSGKWFDVNGKVEPSKNGKADPKKKAPVEKAPVVDPKKSKKATAK